jgi:hypothetical protein
MKKLLLMVLLAAGLSLSGCATATVSAGTLQGHVDIGPLTPVERPGQTVTVPPSVYATVQIMVYSEDGSQFLQRVALSDSGDYQVSLAPGTYRVDFNRDGMRRSADVPKQVTIETGQTVTLNISIDTGIR